MNPKKQTQSPIVTGTTVIAVKYTGGVMIAADTLGSYGGLARFTDIQRIRPVGKYTIVGAGGEISDFDQIIHQLKRLTTEDYYHDDGNELSPKEFYGYLQRVMYNRRNKFDPFWNNIVVVGYRNEAFLGTVDMIGTSFQENYIATGMGSHMATPILRQRWHAALSEGEAMALLQDCLRVCYYRDCRTINKIQFGRVTATGVHISPAVALDTKWDYRSFVNPRAGRDTGGSW